MRRRQFLLASSALLAGCSASPGSDGGGETTPSAAPDGGDGPDTPTGSNSTPGTDTPTSTEPTQTDTWTPGGTASLGPDSNLVRLAVADGFGGEVTLGGTCTGGEDVVLGGGETTEIERESPGEGCSYTVSLNGTVEARDGVAGYETARIEVTPDGGVDVSVLAV